jgi:hypothetical protein
LSQLGCKKPDDRLHSVYIQGYVWPLDEPARGDVRTHGIYSFRDVIRCRVDYGYALGTAGPLLFGTVKIWGEIVEHDAGYRSEFAKIVSLDYGDPELLEKFRGVYNVNQAANPDDARYGLDVRTRAMTVESILSQKGSEVATIAPDASLKTAADWLRAKNIGALIVTSGDSILGIISERDIVRALSQYGQHLTSMFVKDIMVQALITVKPDDDLNHAMRLMCKNWYSIEAHV